MILRGANVPRSLTSVGVLYNPMVLAKPSEAWLCFCKRKTHEPVFGKNRGIYHDGQWPVQTRLKSLKWGFVIRAKANNQIKKIGVLIILFTISNFLQSAKTFKPVFFSLFFQFFLYCHVYDHPQGDLVTFGYRPAMKIKLYLNLFMIIHKEI
jgi:hypothetical protein